MWIPCSYYGLQIRFGVTTGFRNTDKERNIRICLLALCRVLSVLCVPMFIDTSRYRNLERNEYQKELRHSYVGGGPGAIVSGLVWLAAGLAGQHTGITNGFAVLFIGGMFIFPLSKVVLKMFFKRPPVSKTNPGGLIVIETVFPMIGCLFAAWLLLPHRPEFVFPIASIAVGAHYFGFRTAYGDWTYWVLGALLCVIGTASIVYGLLSSDLVPLIVAATEIIFGIWFIVIDKRQNRMANELQPQELND